MSEDYCPDCGKELGKERRNYLLVVDEAEGVDFTVESILCWVNRVVHVGSPKSCKKRFFHANGQQADTPTVVVEKPAGETESEPERHPDPDLQV